MRGKLYLLKAGACYKIGITTKDISVRIKQLQTGCPDKIELIRYVIHPHYNTVEKDFHRILGDKRRSGEWFELDDCTVRMLILLMDYMRSTFNNLNYKFRGL